MVDRKRVHERPEVERKWACQRGSGRAEHIKDIRGIVSGREAETGIVADDACDDGHASSFDVLTASRARS